MMTMLGRAWVRRMGNTASYYLFTALLHVVEGLLALGDLKWNGVRVVDRARTRRLGKSLAQWGEGAIVQHPVVITGPDSVHVGSRSTLSAYVHIWGEGEVRIGDRVMIGTHTSITSLTHDYHAETMRYSLIKKPVEIANDAWIGSNCVILPGIRLGEGCVVGAGSVVTRNIPAGAIAVGVPARVVGFRPDSVAISSPREAHEARKE